MLRTRLTSLSILGAAAAAFVWASVAAPTAGACPVYIPPTDRAPTVTKRGKRFEVKMTFNRRYHKFRGGRASMKKLRVLTRSTKLANFLRKHGRSIALYRAIKKVTDRHSCAALYRGARLQRMERDVARAVTRFYRKQTRRSAGAVALLGVGNASEQYCRPLNRKP